MNIHTLSDHVRPYQFIAPQAVSALYTGSGVDCQSWEGALAIVEMGVITDSAGYDLNLKIQECATDTDANYVDVTDAETGAIDADTDLETYLIELNMSERLRWLRAVVEVGTAGGGLIGATLVPFRGRHLPPTQQNTVIQIEFERA